MIRKKSMGRDPKRLRVQRITKRALECQPPLISVIYCVPKSQFQITYINHFLAAQQRDRSKGVSQGVLWTFPAVGVL